MKEQKPKPKPATGYWPYNPGYNSLLGYKEGKTYKPKSGGLKEYSPDRTVKDGNSLNK